MKKSIIFYMLILIICSTSCTVFSVHPLYDASNQPGDDRLTGLWVDSEDSTSFVKIEGNENFYTLARYEGKDTIWYEAHYASVGDYFYLDLYPLDGKPYKVDDQALLNYLPVHSFVKLEIGTGKVTVSLFDEDKLMKLFRQNRIRLRHELMDDYVLITASTSDLQKFIQKYSASEDVFEAPATFIRLK